MALSRALFMLKIRNEVVNEGEIPEKFLFLDGMRGIRREPSMTDADAYICVDSSDEARLGARRPRFLQGRARGK